jgi:hypothetical protein
MASRSDLTTIVRVPIMIALAVTVMRFTADALNAPDAVSMLLGVAWLHILFPVYFAIKILELGFERPFRTLLKTTVLWALPVRAVIAITYVLGYIYQIDSFRFRAEAFGPVGEGITPLQGLLWLPLLNFGSWMLIGVILAALTGGITLKLKGRSAIRNAA